MMTETTEIKLARMDTKLDMHCKSNDEDLSDLKAGQIRVETKLDTALSQKADKKDVEDLRDNNWKMILGVLVAIITAITTAVLSYIFRKGG